jgi:carboxyl-terminal processing protease
MLTGKYAGVGALIKYHLGKKRVVIDEPYEGMPAAEVGLRKGDIILSIDDTTMVDRQVGDVSSRLRGDAGTSFVVKVKRPSTGKEMKFKITRRNIQLPVLPYYGMRPGNIGYINLNQFTEGCAKEVRRAYIDLKNQGAKALIFDLRGNGGGSEMEAVDIVNLWVPQEQMVVENRGKVRQANRVYKTRLEPVDTIMPMVVLVNGESASASEIASGALQDLDRATVIGTRTFGKGLVQSMVALPYNGQMKVTTAKYYTPSGRCVQNAPDSLTHEFKTAHGRTVRDGGGITPDYIIKGHNYSRLTYSLVVNGIVEQYTLQYVRNHPTIPAVDDFHFTDYDDFVTFAMDKEFDYRSSARTYFDQMKKTLEEDGLAESMSAQLEAMQKALEMDKETFLRLKKDEIIPFIEEEIAVRYYWQEAGIRVRLRYDDQLREALTKAPIQF